MEVLNDIAVRFNKYKQEVKCDVTDNIMVLYNHSDMVNLLTTSNEIFTGIKFDVHEVVGMIFKDLEENSLEVTIRQNWIYITGSKAAVGEPVGYITFVPKNEHKFIEEFNAHFIETVS